MKNAYLYHAFQALKEITNGIIADELIEKAGKTIQTCSIVAAASGVGASLFPGGGAIALSAVSVGAIWTMYIRINDDLGISISKNTLKSLASALLSNIITGAGAFIISVVAVTVIGFIPGLNFLMVPAQALIAYIMVFSAAILYVKILTKIFKAKGSFNISENDVDGMAKSIVGETDMNAMINSVKDSYKEDKGKIKQERKKNNAR